MAEDDGYEKLRAQLELLEWPQVYMFKFIAPNESDKVAQLSALFDEGTDLQIKQSSTGKFSSVGAKEMMLSPESVIEKYKKAAQIKGVILL